MNTQLIESPQVASDAQDADADRSVDPAGIYVPHPFELIDFDDLEIVAIHHINVC